MNAKSICLLVSISVGTACSATPDAPGEGGGGSGASTTSATTASHGGGGSGAGGSAQGGAGGAPQGGGGAGGGGSAPVCAPGEQSSCYSGPPEALGVGICKAGKATCLPDGSGFGPCEGEVLPAPTDDCATPEDEDCDGFATMACGLVPLPPTMAEPAWQSRQDRLAKDGAPCAGDIVLSVGDRAVCWASVEDKLLCAGAVYDTTFGTTFTDASAGDPVQALISPTFNSATGNGLCVLRKDGTMACKGDYNSWGQFGTGATGPSSGFVTWGMKADLTRVATGTWDQICATTMAGEAICSGYGFTISPTSEGAGAWLWIDTFGMLWKDDPTTLRASNGRSECTVTAAGLECPTPYSPFGAPGHVVDGGYRGGSNEVCYLSDDGLVECIKGLESGMPVKQAHFGGDIALALGVSFYTTSMCAVMQNGSLRCLGANAAGQLGTGDTAPLTSPAEVAPAGAVRLGCD